MSRRRRRRRRRRPETCSSGCLGRCADGESATSSGRSGRSAASAPAVQLRLLAKDRLLEPDQGGARVDAQLLHKRFTQVGVSPQHVRLPTAPVERNHLLARQSLAKRVLANKLCQLTAQCRVPAKGKLSLDAVFERGEPQLGEPGDLGLGEWLEREVRQRLPTPQ